MTALASAPEPTPTDRYVPDVGDEVEVVIVGVVESYKGGNRVLAIRHKSSLQRHLIHWDARALVHDDGLTVRKITPP